MPKFKKSYAAKTGLNTRGAATLLKAYNAQVEYVENVDGDRLRVWKKEDLQRFTHDEIAMCLKGRRFVEDVDMLNIVPPTAIKYCVSRGYLIHDAKLSVYFVTWKAAAELKLPLVFRGKTVKFVKGE